MGSDVSCSSPLETIVAPATPPGRGGVAMIRISGPRVKEIAVAILGQVPKPRYAAFSIFRDADGQAIDEGLALFFPNPHSFTGEDVLELHGHGGPYVVDSLIKRILELGARYARPGEFSERAFLNDKLDLAQAEAIADLIDASSTQAARSALRSLQGEFSKKIHSLVEAVIRLRMYIEAAIDFVEEEIDFLADEQVTNQLESLVINMELIRSQATQGTLLREGITAVIAGQPNVGKSSLLNALSGKDSAIVTDIAGTTRDVLREHINIDGLPMHVIDTAGLRESNDLVEQEGIRRAKDEISKADLVLFVIDASAPQKISLSDVLSNIPEHAAVITIHNKMDLLAAPLADDIKEDKNIFLSVKTGAGLEELKQQIKLTAGFQSNTEGLFSARRRHLDALDRATDFLQSATYQLTHHKAGELVAEDLRQVQMALNEITGEFTSDDLLGRIFSSFCIGK
jgi:tRNA modification GTPase